MRSLVPASASNTGAVRFVSFRPLLLVLTVVSHILQMAIHGRFFSNRDSPPRIPPRHAVFFQPNQGSFVRSQPNRAKQAQLTSAAAEGSPYLPQTAGPPKVCPMHSAITPGQQVREPPWGAAERRPATYKKTTTIAYGAEPCRVDVCVRLPIEDN